MIFSQACTFTYLTRIDTIDAHIAELVLSMFDSSCPVLIIALLLGLLLIFHIIVDAVLVSLLVHVLVVLAFPASELLLVCVSCPQFSLFTYNRDQCFFTSNLD